MKTYVPTKARVYTDARDLVVHSHPNLETTQLSTNGNHPSHATPLSHERNQLLTPVITWMHVEGVTMLDGHIGYSRKEKV